MLLYMARELGNMTNTHVPPFEPPLRRNYTNFPLKRASGGDELDDGVSNLAIYDKAATSSVSVSTLRGKWSSGEVLLATWGHFYVLLPPPLLPLDLRMMIGFISLRLALLRKKADEFRSGDWRTTVEMAAP